MVNSNIAYLLEHKPCSRSYANNCFEVGVGGVNPHTLISLSPPWDLQIFLKKLTELI